MADIMFNVGPNFNMYAFTEQLAGKYRAEGYSVTVAYLNGSVVMGFDKGTGGINMVLGLGEGIKANIALNGNVLMISFIDAEWTGKIIGLTIGWFLCVIPAVTAIIGAVNQSQLPKKIGQDAQMIASQFFG